jgi:hypothetical protein
MRKDDALLGIFTIFRQEVRPKRDRAVAELRRAGGHTMENARLLTETREALEPELNSKAAGLPVSD